MPPVRPGKSGTMTSMMKPAPKKTEKTVSKVAPKESTTARLAQEKAAAEKASMHDCSKCCGCAARKKA